jgi:hypothetical protein
MMIPTPILRNANSDTSMYRGQALAQLRILKQQMQLGNLKIGTRTVDFGNGVTCFCNICFNLEEVFIRIARINNDIVSIAGIIFHPRSGKITQIAYTEYTANELGSNPVSRYTPGVVGGWANGVTPLTTGYVFPLVDEDNASFVLNAKDSGLFSGSEGNYGNLYWSNGATTLSWRGTPTRHFRLPNSIEIPGISTFETSVHGLWEDTPQYTTFGTNLYQGGIVLAKAPHYSWPYNGSGVGGQCLILGAMQDTKGIIYIVTQSDHYNAPESVKLGDTDHPLTKSGFWLTLWKSGSQLDKWDLISEFNYGRNGLPWFGNSNGTEFVCSNGDRLTASGAFSGHAGTGGGTYKEVSVLRETSGNVNYYSAFSMSFEATYSGDDYSEYKGLIPVSSPIGLTFSASSALQSTPGVSKTYTGEFPILTQIAPLILGGPDAWTGNPGNFWVSGGEGPYSWTYPSNSCSPNVGSISVRDCHGSSVTRPLRLSGNGYWLYNEDLCCVEAADVPADIVDRLECYVNCNVICIETSYTTKRCYNLIIGWAGGWEGLCNSCGPLNANIQTSSSSWACP